MVIHKEDRTLEVNDPELKIFDYKLPGVKLGISYQEAHGRVPSTGATVNTVCEECYYILEGTARITVGAHEFDLKPGDVAIVPPATPSYLVSDGLKYLTITNPDWYAEQSEIRE
jgi:mannose-6-phosphate isomerase-like protein (cupin superfamily)